MAVTVAMAALVGTSVFAESRRSNGTEGGRVQRDGVRSGRVEARGQVGRGNETTTRATERSDRSRRDAAVERRSQPRREETPSSDSFNRRDGNRSNERGGESYRRNDRSGQSGSRYDRNDRNDRNGSRNGSYRNGGSRNGGSRNHGGYRNDGGYRNNGGYRNHGHRNHGNRYYHHGRVTQYHRYGGGYRVWIGGAPYPFYVPLAYWNPHRFRIGVSIGLGGYYNPGGYYDYYDGYRDGVRDSRYNERRLHSEADFVGMVESIDYRRDEFVVRNEATGNFITVVLRDRREGFVRVGDYVAVRGDWTTRGYFHAYDVDILD
jgi:hypothetical protein